MDSTGLTFLLAQDHAGDDAAAAAGGIVATLFGGAFCVVWLLVVVLVIVGYWKTFVKAGKPGWAAIVPIYNVMVLGEIGGKPTWWGLLVLIPCVGIVFYFMICIEVAKRFGKDVVFGVLLALFSGIFFPILGFGDARYQGGATS